MIRVGIVGTGNTVGIAHFHALGLMADGRAAISAVYDVRSEGAGRWVADHGLQAAVCESYEDLLSRVDAVIICVPNAFHSDYALAAIDADRHFLVEKPLAVRIEDSRRLAAAAKGFRKAAMVGFVYRFANPIVEARRIARERIGRVFSCTAWMGGKRLADPGLPLEWRMRRALSGSGALGDFGSHLVDLADFVAGQRYETVAGMTGRVIPLRPDGEGMKPVENDDLSAFIANGPAGLGSYTVSRTGMDELTLLVTGEGGMLRASLRTPDGLTYWEKRPDGGYTGTVQHIELAPQKAFDGWFEAEMAAFLDWIEGKPSHGADVAQGLYVEEVLHAVQRSSVSGRQEKVFE